MMYKSNIYYNIIIRNVYHVFMEILPVISKFTDASLLRSSDYHAQSPKIYVFLFLTNNQSVWQYT